MNQEGCTKLLTTALSITATQCKLHVAVNQKQIYIPINSQDKLELQIQREIYQIYHVKQKKSKLHNDCTLQYSLCKCLNHALLWGACICSKNVKIQKQLFLGKEGNEIRMEYTTGVCLCGTFMLNLSGEYMGVYQYIYIFVRCLIHFTKTRGCRTRVFRELLDLIWDDFQVTLSESQHFKLCTVSLTDF